MVWILYLERASWAKNWETKAHHAITSPTSPVPAGQSLVPLTFWPGASILQLGSGAVLGNREKIVRSLVYQLEILILQLHMLLPLLP